MDIIISIPILGALVILQSAIMSDVTLLHGTSDLVMLAVIAWAMQERVQSAWQWGIIGGLFVTLVSGLPFFVPLISYLITVGVVLLLRKRVWNFPILAMFVGTFIGTLIMHLLSILALRITGVSISLIQSFNIITLPSLILNILLAIPIYALIRELANIRYPVEIEA